VQRLWKAIAHTANRFVPRDAAGNRNSALDGYRGVAVLLVTVSHSSVPIVRYGGGAGVTLFFVLSGYLITSLLVAEHTRAHTISLGSFYTRRGLRLLPALVVALAGGTLLAIAFGAAVGRTLTAAGASLFYVNNIAHTIDVGTHPFGNLWSLSLEEQYYLLWPAFLLVALRMPRNRVVGLTLALALVSVVWRFALPITTREGYENASYLPQTTVFAILFGSAVALALSGGWQPRMHPLAPRLAFVGLLATSSLLGLRTGFYEKATGTTYVMRLTAPTIAAVLGVVLIIDAVTTRHMWRWISHPVLLFFGTISYALYLWHGILDHILGQEFGSSGVRGFFVGSTAAVSAVVVAMLSFRYVERPFLTAKRRFERAGSTTASVGRPEVVGTGDGVRAADETEGIGVGGDRRDVPLQNEPIDVVKPDR
jgi:peptidoglycan/LPS O-acetylase OafA/YrhL